MRKRLLSKEQEEELKEDFPFYGTHELAERYGLSYRSLKGIAYRLHLKKDAETVNESRKKARKKIMAEERRRMLFGLPQETQYVIHTNPKRVHLRDCHRYNSRKRGYVECEDKKTFYYDSKTKRSQQHEEYGAKKYGFKYIAS